ncbi:MAG: hypothetical protein CMP05_07330 [Xanthomarina sp.]|uniref:hypothetical protein n=1 Tax=Xanthomarina TaxID=1868329 RepID=UPI000C4AF876|nr:hypothetical protein [Xanthomarina sp.]MAL22682.1 hypothetical protein [Xanthomarina sp.]MBF61796.1 hypothetical protein [Xanthomarina sp.]HAB27587.1 hypothetical protein [Xanthomarina gelatinilytica]HAI18781.1 hypothetical protein [Xanthomarina gelatinilytica]|tara:strand:+ start:157 stop:393 length:237 start_codon:yes stop_codon:yes gene_type:complete
MILTDKQSLILCTVVVLGFSISGIIGILGNYVIVAVLLILFLLVVINLFTNKKLFEKEQKSQEVEEETVSALNEEDIL